MENKIELFKTFLKENKIPFKSGKTFVSVYLFKDVKDIYFGIEDKKYLFSWGIYPKYKNNIYYLNFQQFAETNNLIIDNF